MKLVARKRLATSSPSNADCRIVTRVLLLVPALAAALVLSACTLEQSSNSVFSPATITTVPKRIISLDYCADQYVLKLAAPQQILALSPDADARYSYLREEASGHARVLPRAENIISLQPDLVVRSYGGGPSIVNFLERAGVPVVQLPWVSHVDGDTVNTAPAAIAMVAEAVGNPSAGEALIADYRGRLAAIPHRSQRKSALYMSAAGVTTGPGSLVHEMLLTAGLENFQRRAGWRALPLEELAYDSPDVTAAAFFNTYTTHPARWSASRHPVARKLKDVPDTVMLDGASTACGGWFIADAIEALAQGAAR